MVDPLVLDVLQAVDHLRGWRGRRPHDHGPGGRARGRADDRRGGGRGGVRHTEVSG